VMNVAFTFHRRRQSNLMIRRHAELQACGTVALSTEAAFNHSVASDLLLIIIHVVAFLDDFIHAVSYLKTRLFGQ